MDLLNRINTIHNLFCSLENTSGRNEKEYLVAKTRAISEQLSKDLDWCFEYLSGQHKLGFRVDIEDTINAPNYWFSAYTEKSIEEFLKPLYANTLEDKSLYNIRNLCNTYDGWGFFLNPLLNREWRLGINKSQVEKTDISPMLAKKFELAMKPISSRKGYYITEKLDGNRCIAKYSFQDKKWKFYSRSGKEMRVQFDMSSFNVNYIYDGEVLSIEQINNPSQQNFNTLSGKINNKEIKDDLVYYVFDVVDDCLIYEERRRLLEYCAFMCSNNVKVLPILKWYDSWEDLCDHIMKDLIEVTNRGGEGVMINVGDAKYQHKRTDKLLKLKLVQTMDMKVIGLVTGTGKNESLVGSLECIAQDGDNVYTCMVGSGLNDLEREIWICDPDKIIGKIVEVQYFSLSQDKDKAGTNKYSLRFPRLKKVRYDKNDTSIF